jgi:hypothetical protein
MEISFDEVEAHKKIILDSSSKFISQAIVQAKRKREHHHLEIHQVNSMPIE